MDLNKINKKIVLTNNINNIKNSKTIKRKQGALEFKLEGKSHLVLNWNDGMVEVWFNNKREFVIDLND